VEQHSGCQRDPVLLGKRRLYSRFRVYPEPAVIELIIYFIVDRPISGMLMFAYELARFNVTKRAAKKSRGSMSPLRLMSGFDHGLLASKEPESVVAAASRMLSLAAMVR